MSSPSFLNDLAALICRTDVLPHLHASPHTLPSIEHSIGDPGSQPDLQPAAAQRLQCWVQPRGPRALNLRSTIFKYAQRDPGTGFFPASRICPKVHVKTKERGPSTLSLASISDGEKNTIIYIPASLEGHSTCTKGWGRDPVCWQQARQRGCGLPPTPWHRQRWKG